MQDLTYGNNSGTPGVGADSTACPTSALYNAVNPTTISQAQYNGRLDGYATQKDHLTFAIYWVPITMTNYRVRIVPPTSGITRRSTMRFPESGTMYSRRHC